MHWLNCYITYFKTFLKNGLYFILINILKILTCFYMFYSICFNDLTPFGFYWLVYRNHFFLYIKDGGGNKNHVKTVPESLLPFTYTHKVFSGGTTVFIYIKCVGM